VGGRKLVISDRVSRGAQPRWGRNLPWLGLRRRPSGVLPSAVDLIGREQRKSGAKSVNRPEMAGRRRREAGNGGGGGSPVGVAVAAAARAISSNPQRR
jgi:hypothetical protein